MDANPGFLWLIGNEPECIWQGDTTPEDYAEVYHHLKDNLLAWGSYGKITIPSVLGLGSPYHWIIIACVCAGIILLFRGLERRGL